MPGGLDREFDRLQRDGEPVAGVPSRLGEAAAARAALDERRGKCLLQFAQQ